MTGALDVASLVLKDSPMSVLAATVPPGTTRRKPGFTTDLLAGVGEGRVRKGGGGGRERGEGGGRERGEGEGWGEGRERGEGEGGREGEGREE